MQDTLGITDAGFEYDLIPWKPAISFLNSERMQHTFIT